MYIRCPVVIGGIIEPMNRSATVAALHLGLVFACQAQSLATPADAEYTAQSKKATHAMDAGQFDDAIAACKKMVAVAPTLPLKSQALLMMEDAASTGHKYKISIAAMTECIGLNKPVQKAGSTYIDTMIWRRGKAYAASGEYAPALADFQYVQPTRTTPREIVNLMQDQSACHEKLKQYDKCIADLSRALKYSDQILGEKSNEATITRVKGEKISLMYQRAKMYAAAGKMEESRRDKALADKLTDAW